MRNIILRLAFVGTNYAGWQRQKNGFSVQEVIETAISKITGEEISLVGCSRTDAGVHAEDYVANFGPASSIPADKFQPAIQTKLPRDIQILKSGEAPSSLMLVGAATRRRIDIRLFRYFAVLSGPLVAVWRTHRFQRIAGIGGLIGWERTIFTVFACKNR